MTQLLPCNSWLTLGCASDATNGLTGEACGHRQAATSQNRNLSTESKGVHTPTGPTPGALTSTQCSAVLQDQWTKTDWVMESVGLLNNSALVTSLVTSRRLLLMEAHVVLSSRLLLHATSGQRQLQELPSCKPRSKVSSAGNPVTVHFGPLTALHDSSLAQ